MNGFRVLLGFGALLAATAAHADGGYTVSDVTAISCLPWTDYIDISFTVTPPAGASARAVELDVVASNGVDEVYVSEASLSTRLASASGRQHVLWFPKTDHAGATYSQLRFHVSVKGVYAGTPPYMLLKMNDGAVSYADFAITNILKRAPFLQDYMAFRYVPPTTSEEWKALSGGSEYFTLGAPAQDAGYNVKSDLDIIRESPRRVKLTKGYYLGVYPVTWGQIERMGWSRSKIAAPYVSYPSTADTLFMDYSGVVTGLSYEELRGADTVDGYNYPATKEVDPDSLLGVLRARSGLAFDLPSDAQWEYAARAGCTNAYWFTETDTVPPESAFSTYTCSGTGYAWTRACNRWGFYGVMGCCHQWTTTLGRTSDNGSSTANFAYADDGAEDPTGPATTYSHGWRIARGSHCNANNTMTNCRDGSPQVSIRYHVYRTAYKFPMKADCPAENQLCGARLCLTLE